MGQPHNNPDQNAAADLPFLWLRPLVSRFIVILAIVWLFISAAAGWFASYCLAQPSVASGPLSAAALALMAVCAWMSWSMQRGIAQYLKDRRTIVASRLAIARGEPVAPELLANLALRSAFHGALGVERLREMEASWGVLLPRIWLISSEIPQRRFFLWMLAEPPTASPSYQTDQDKAGEARGFRRGSLWALLIGALGAGVTVLFFSNHALGFLGTMFASCLTLLFRASLDTYPRWTIQPTAEGLSLCALERSWTQNRKLDPSAAPIPIALGTDLVILRVRVPAETASPSAAVASRKQQEPLTSPIKCRVWISRAPENVTPVPNPSGHSPLDSDRSNPPATPPGPKWISGGPLLIGPTHPLWHVLQAGPAELEPR